MRVAVCISGRGSNLEALIKALPPGSPAEVVLVISNRPKAGGVFLAQGHNIPTHILADPADPAEWLTVLKAHDVGFVVLAGFLKKVPEPVLTEYRWRIINIHPSLLPNHGGPGMYGMHVHRAVLARGDHESGASVHLVTAEYDEGPVLARMRVPVQAADTPEELAARVLKAEHKLIVDAVLAAAAYKGRAVSFNLAER